MTRKRGGNPPGRLSAEDRALWQAFSQAITPADTKKRVPERGAPDALNHDSRETLAARQPQLARSSRKAAARPGASKPHSGQQPKPASAPSAPPPPAFDRKTVKKLAKGRLEVDARIDLHGMRQAEAHTALRGFLNRAAQQGYRTVLVITGKGGDPGGTNHWQPEREESWRGILRRSVPMWLSGPEFSSLVTSFTTANVRHGGDGAFYVQIRRSMRGKPGA